jgi:hypothetical protein
MITCNLEKENTISFDLEMTGVKDSDNPKIYLNIINKESKLSFNVVSDTKNKYKVIVPVLDTILEPGIYNMEIQIFVGTRSFIPFTDTIEFKSMADSVQVKFSNFVTEKKQLSNKKIIETKSSRKNFDLLSPKKQNTCTPEVIAENKNGSFFKVIKTEIIER